MIIPDRNTQQYQENTITSAKPEELTLMMYNGLLKFIARAQEEIQAKSLEAAHNTLIRCQDIVFEFQFTLNMEYEVSNNLMLLYDYLYNKLIEANAKKDCEILDEVAGFVAELRDTWLEAVAKGKEQKAEAAAETAAAAEPAETVGEGAQAPEQPKQSSVKAIYTRGALPVGTRPRTVPAAPVAVATALSQPISEQTVASAQPVKQPRPAVPIQPQQTQPAVRSQSQSVVTAPQTVNIPGAFGQAATAARVLNNPMNRMNPAVAAQYAKVSKSKTPARGSISLATE